eukprot:CAMPEP_0171308342 /NCGR_PEP_ID=MMETSP0816-20121228/18487_1 /TAXON_ID=420281 /ORGANISM="Proboscia inermis, Strain CCAP1064/1" /LENGTH=53 /DNA_ID=CAMNT_0011791189 /DNA_START=206 /DNA_END=367 /DNA_ORIENTATION=-
MVSICFLVHPPPIPSAASLNPSSWRHSVNQHDAAVEIAAAIGGGRDRMVDVRV